MWVVFGDSKANHITLLNHWDFPEKLLRSLHLWCFVGKRLKGTVDDLWRKKESPRRNEVISAESLNCDEFDSETCWVHKIKLLALPVKKGKSLKLNVGEQQKNNISACWCFPFLEKTFFYWISMLNRVREHIDDKYADGAELPLQGAAPEPSRCTFVCEQSKTRADWKRFNKIDITVSAAVADYFNPFHVNPLENPLGSIETWMNNNSLWQNKW